MQALSAQNTTLLPITTGAPEHYEPLWWYSGSYGGWGVSTSGSYFVGKGTTAYLTSANTSSAKTLFTLNANWPITTKFAFEAVLYLSASATGYMALWDLTSNTIVSASQVSTSATTATVLRSGLFTLAPGHSYGVTVWSTANSTYFTDCSLIVFPQ